MILKLYIGPGDLCIVKSVPYIKPGLLVSMSKIFSENGIPYVFEVELDDSEVNRCAKKSS